MISPGYQLFLCKFSFCSRKMAEAGSSEMETYSPPPMQLEIVNSLMNLSSPTESFSMFCQHHSVAVYLEWIKYLSIMAPIRLTWPAKFYSSNNSFAWAKYLSSTYKKDQLLLLGFPASGDVPKETQALLKVALLIWRSVGSALLQY